MEIITAPDIRNSFEASQFVKQLLSILQSIQTCDGHLAGSEMLNEITINIPNFFAFEFLSFGIHHTDIDHP